MLSLSSWVMSARRSLAVQLDKLVEGVRLFDALRLLVAVQPVVDRHQARTSRPFLGCLDEELREPEEMCPLPLSVSGSTSDSSVSFPHSSTAPLANRTRLGNPFSVSVNHEPSRDLAQRPCPAAGFNDAL